MEAQKQMQEMDLLEQSRELFLLAAVLLHGAAEDDGVPSDEAHECSQ